MFTSVQLGQHAEYHLNLLMASKCHYMWWNGQEYKSNLPVLKLMMRSSRNTVSEMELNTIHRVLRSSLKNEMATGRMIRLAISRINMNKSQ